MQERMRRLKKGRRMRKKERWRRRRASALNAKLPLYAVIATSLIASCMAFSGMYTSKSSAAKSPLVAGNNLMQRSRDGDGLPYARTCENCYFPKSRSFVSLHMSTNNGNNNNEFDFFGNPIQTSNRPNIINSNPMRALVFSIVLAASAALIGPFLDSYLAAFQVIKYKPDAMIVLQNLWGSPRAPALDTSIMSWIFYPIGITTIGWLQIYLDSKLDVYQANAQPGESLAFFGLSLSSFEYWLSGILHKVARWDETEILYVLVVVTAFGLGWLDSSAAGILTGLATSVFGSLFQITVVGSKMYQFVGSDSGVVPLWVVPLYALGGLAVGNAARCLWAILTPQDFGQEGYYQFDYFEDVFLEDGDEVASGGANSVNGANGVQQPAKGASSQRVNGAPPQQQQRMNTNVNGVNGVNGPQQQRRSQPQIQQPMPRQRPPQFDRNMNDFNWRPRPPPRQRGYGPRGGMISGAPDDMPPPPAFRRSIYMQPRQFDQRYDAAQQFMRCPVCDDTRRIKCPDCNAQGTVFSADGQQETCPKCNGRRQVICPNCIGRYNDGAVYTVR